MSEFEVEAREWKAHAATVPVEAREWKAQAVTAPVSAVAKNGLTCSGTNSKELLEKSKRIFDYGLMKRLYDESSSLPSPKEEVYLTNNGKKVV